MTGRGLTELRVTFCQCSHRTHSIAYEDNLIRIAITAISHPNHGSWRNACRNTNK